MDWLKIFIGLVLITISALWIDLSLHLPFPSFARVAKVGPAHFPLLVASLLALLTLIWLAREYHKKEGEKEVHGVRLIPWYLGYAGYITITPFLGFVPSAFLLVTAVVASKTKGPWGSRLGKGLLAAAVITGLEWGIFQKWLGVPLPVGFFSFWGGKA